jgi:hypothetical protein
MNITTNMANGYQTEKMSIVEKYLNLEPNLDIFKKLNLESMIDLNIKTYNKCYKEYFKNPENIKNHIKEEIDSYIEKNYTLINIIDADINYYIEKINNFMKKKFRDIVSEINIEHIISFCDYKLKNIKKYNNSNSNDESETKVSNYIYWRNEYYSQVYKKIICGLYKPIKSQQKTELNVLIENFWENINFDNIIQFTKTINKIKFLGLYDSNKNSEENFIGQNIDTYINIISDKFDLNQNLIKLIDYITESFKDEKDNSLKKKYESDNSEDNEENDYSEIFVEELKKTNSKYNFRFIVDNMKLNGYMLFEEFNKNLKKKYKKPQPINIIKSDKNIINYFIYLVSQKDSNSVNRKVNEILLRMRDYICDIQDSFYNNIGYQKITVKQESEKYKNLDLSSFNRENCQFTIFKYSNTYSNPVSEFKLNKDTEPYFDIYKAYYNSRYPDRQVEFDPFQSTLIIKMIFMEKIYYIHLSLIQYIVLDKIFNNGDNHDGINILEISEKTSIPIKYLQESINSLLHIKIIKRSSDSKTIEGLKFYINYDFEYKTNKLSICSLINKTKEDEEEKKEFLHDRNTILLSNMYDYIKKNKTFTKDVLITELKHKIPFKITLEQIESVIKVLLDKEDVVKIEMPNPYEQNGISDFIYKYVE